MPEFSDFLRFGQFQLRDTEAPETMYYMSKLDGNEITKELISCIHTYDYLCLSRTQKWFVNSKCSIVQLSR